MNWDKSKERHWSFQDCQVAARALGGAKRPMPRNNAAGANELTPGGGTRDEEQPRREQPDSPAPPRLLIEAEYEYDFQRVP